MIKDQTFTRTTIKSRLQDLIVQRWGYEKYEQNAFDPLVDLLISSLSKELEKGHLLFEKSFNRVIDYITDRLVPERLNEFEPAYGIVMAQPVVEQCALDASNFKAVYSKEDNQEIQFVPLGTTYCSPIEIAAVANFNSLFEYETLLPRVLSSFEYKTNNIWIGLDYKDYDESQKLNLFFNWMGDPLFEEYISLLKLSTWMINDEVIEADFDGYLKFHLDDEYYWQDILAKEKIEIVHQKVYRHFVSLGLKSDYFANKETPKFLKNLIKEDPQLAPMNELLWIRINVPPHELSKSLSQNLFCQTNCVPVINLNRRSFSKKIRAPFKIVKIDDEDFFLEIVNIENSEGKKYVKMNEEVARSKDRIQGSYQVFSKGVIRVDQKMAYESIVNMIDLIIEEKNAYSAINPDWIVDELKVMDLTINKIKKKSNLDKSLINNTTFLQFENELNEDFIRIEYLTINGKAANGIKIGNQLNAVSPISFVSGVAVAVIETKDGSSFMPEKERRLELVSRIQSRNSITTRKDIEVHLRKEISPLKIKSIHFDKSIAKSFSKKVGFHNVYEVNIILEDNALEELDLLALKNRLQVYLDTKAMLGAPLQISLN